MIEKKYATGCCDHDYCAGWNDAVDAMPKWISVQERLPEEHADGSVDAVLVTDGEFTHMAYYAQGQWFFCESGEMKEPMWNTVTHWMFLPELPKED